MISNLSIQPLGRNAYLVSWSSDVADATFRVFVDGVLVATTSATQWTITTAAGAAPVIEVLDDPTAIPQPAFPGTLQIAFNAVGGVDRYLLQELIGSTWTTFKTINEIGAGYYLAPTRFLEDSIVHRFRVLAVGINGNDGTAAELSCLMVRHPDPPAARYAYDAATRAVTISAA